MLTYFLVENALTFGSSSRVARVKSLGTKTLSDVINLMIAEGTGLTRPQAFAYFEKLLQSIEFFIGQGFRVTTPLVRLKPSIGGVFTSPEDLLDPARHKVRIRTSSGSRMLELPGKIRIEKGEMDKPRPILRSFIDGVNKQLNETAVSDGYGTITGKRLKFDPNDSRLGAFFVPVDDPLNEIPMLGYLEIMPGKLHFRIPVLAAGVYKVIVNTLSHNGVEVLTGELKYKIRVD